MRFRRLTSGHYVGIYPYMDMNEACLCTGLRQAALAATEMYDEALAPSGLKITMFRVLRRAAEAGRPSITRLADVVGLDRSSLGRNLKVLERNGLIAFESDRDDDRSKIVVLTTAGKAALKMALPLWKQAQFRMQAALGPDSNAVFHILSKVNVVAH